MTETRRWSGPLAGVVAVATVEAAGVACCLRCGPFAENGASRTSAWSRLHRFVRCVIDVGEIGAKPLQTSVILLPLSRLWV
jgi:hypothetical protein